ncbi:MAG: PIG-L family deacetylase [Chloroflexota bacterium]|nr:PIG-L family deacetylase [Chloroflexota bacterium]
MTDSLRLLAVFAHPDDESMGMGGTLAKYSAEGVDTYLVCATRGERGWSGPQEADPGPEALGAIRTRELEEAVELLGMKGLYFLDYIDGDLDRADPAEAIARIVTHVRRIMPQVVVTFPPDGNYGHPDHIAVGQLTNAALVCAADSNYIDPENFAPFRVSKLYYLVDSEEFIRVVTPFIGDLTFPVDEQLRGAIPWPEWMITTRIDMADYCDRAWRAIRCHQTQLPTLGLLADLHEEAGAALLGMQGTFYRAFSLVNGGRRIEKDLFGGIRA